MQNVGALLGAARAYLLQKQVPKAKAILKRVISHPWSIANADYLEKCMKLFLYKIPFAYKIYLINFDSM